MTNENDTSAGGHADEFDDLFADLLGGGDDPFAPTADGDMNDTGATLGEDDLFASASDEPVALDDEPAAVDEPAADEPAVAAADATAVVVSDDEREEAQHAQTVQARVAAPAGAGQDLVSLLSDTRARLEELTAQMAAMQQPGAPAPEPVSDLPALPPAGENRSVTAQAAAPDDGLAERLEQARRRNQRRQLLAGALDRFEAGLPLSEDEAALLAEEGVDVSPAASAPREVADEPVEPSAPAAPAAAHDPVDWDAAFAATGDGDEAQHRVAPSAPEPPAAMAPADDDQWAPDYVPAPAAHAEEQWEPEAPAPAAHAEEQWEPEAPVPAAHATEQWEPEAPAPAAHATEGGDESWAGEWDGEDFSHLSGGAQAFSSVDEDAMAAVDRSFEPVDVLWAVGVRDRDSEEALRTTQGLEKMQKEAKTRTRKTKRGGGAKVVLPRLPFSTIEGSPLVIAVYSPKGGAGKSTTSVNLGALIAASAAKSTPSGEAPPRVLVMDGDVANGNLAIRVANRLEPNLLELIEWMDHNGDLTDYVGPSPDHAGMADFVLSHEDLPNLNVLAAPDNPEAFEDFTTEDFERILNMLGRFYSVIIIDCGTEIVMHSNQTWLRHAHQVFLLTLPERAALHSAGKSARLITRAGSSRPVLVSPERLHIVMMRADADLGFDPRHAIETTFAWANESQVTYFRDFDRETARANNAGEFLSLSNGSYAQDVGALAKAAFNDYASSGRRRGR